MIPKRKLGATGLEISCLALGGLFLSRLHSHGETLAIVRRAAELGINYVDTSPSYADSERELGKALAQTDAEFIISTKAGNLPADQYRPRDPAFLRAAVEKSFADLGRDRIDIFYIHEADRPELHDWWTDKDAYNGPILDLLKEYRDEGKIGCIGLGGTTTVEMARMLDTGKFSVVLSAFQYSLLWREALDSVFPAVRRVGAGLVCGSPLQQGVLSRAFRRDVAEDRTRWLSEPRRRQLLRLYDFADECGIPLPELALRFILSHPQVATVLTGANSVAQLEANVESAAKGPLPADILAALDDIHAMVPFRPYQEPFALYFAEMEEEALRREEEYRKAEKSAGKAESP